MPYNKLRQFFSVLDRLQQTIFAGYLRGTDSLQMAADRQALYHICQSLRKNPSADLPIHEAERLYEMILSLGQLRFRVTDRALFEVCHQEFSQISLVLSSLFSKGDASALQNFRQCLDDFESLHEQVLCVSAPDPVVFLFFFQHLEDCYNEMAVLCKS